MCLSCILSLNTYAATQADDIRTPQQKEIERSFPVRNDTRLSITNCSGNITVEHWDKKEIRIRVSISKKTSNAGSNQEIPDDVSVQWKQSGNLIQVETEDRNTSHRLLTDYVVTLPASVPMELKQVLGSIKLTGNHTGKIRLESEFGDISGGSVTGDIDIACDFSTIDFENLARVELRTNHAKKIKIGRVEKLNAMCYFSHLTTGDINEGRLEIQHGSATLGSCRRLTILSQLSDITVEKIVQTASIHMSFGKMTIKEVDKNFEKVESSVQFNTFLVSLPASASCRIDARTESGRISFDKAFRSPAEVKTEFLHICSLDAVLNGGKKGRFQFTGERSSLEIKAI